MISELFEKHKLARRFSLFWCLGLISFVAYRATEADVLMNISTGGATVVTSLIAILSAVIGFYQWHRSQDDKRD